MKRTRNEKNLFNNRIVAAIEKIGIKETEQLLINFLNGNDYIQLDGDAGLIMAAFVPYYEKSTMTNDMSIVKGFIAFNLSIKPKNDSKFDSEKFDENFPLKRKETITNADRKETETPQEHAIRLKKEYPHLFNK